MGELWARLKWGRGCIWKGHTWFYVEPMYRVCSHCERHQIRIQLPPSNRLKWIRVTG